VLSGNRNFEGRIHPLVRANYLASPPLVVAYALAAAWISTWPPNHSATTKRQARLPARHLAFAAGNRIDRARQRDDRDVSQGVRRSVFRATLIGKV